MYQIRLTVMSRICRRDFLSDGKLNGSRFDLNIERSIVTDV